MYPVLKRFFIKSISRQLMLGIALVHAVLMSIFVYDLVGRERDFMIEQSREQAIGLSETLSANGSSWLLANDFIGIEEVISSQSGFKNLRYAMFTDMTGKVLGFTDRDAVGQYLHDEISLTMLSHTTSTLTLVDNADIIDVASPVFANDMQIGWARVGVSREGILDNLRLVTRNGLLYTLIAIVVGVLFAWMMAKGLTQDIRTLLLAARKVQEGQRDIDFKLDREDELGELSRDFSETVTALSENEERFKFMLDNSPVAVSIATQSGKHLIYVNPTFESLFNAGFETAVAKNPCAYYVDPRDYDTVLNRVAQGVKVNNQLIKMKNSKWVLASYLSIPYEGEDAVLGWFFDITERKQAEEELQKLTRAVEFSSSAVIMTDTDTDTDGNMEYVNPKFTEVTGYSKHEVLGENIRILKPGVTPVSTYEDMWATINTQGVWKGEFQNRRKDGSLYWNRASTSSVKNAKGENTHYISIQDDVTHEYELSEKLSYQASHDVLTGLVNRREFEGRIEKLFSTVKEDKAEHALCFMDLDQFKVVNDTCGHIAGDEMLRQLSMLLQQVVRKHDTLARLGGDEFGVS